MKPCHIDGLIYVLIAFFGAISSALSQDDAAKYVEPATLWVTRNLATAIAAALLALKMFRSTSYSDFLNKTKWVENAKDNPPSLTMQSGQDQSATLKIDTTTKIQTIPESKPPTV